MKRVVLDTNVLIAGLRSRRGASFALLKALRAGRYVAVASVPLFLEYEALLKRESHLLPWGGNSQAVDVFLDALASLMAPVEMFFLWRPQLRDPADEMVLETALNGSAAAIVTFNTRDFLPAAQRLGVAVMGPADFLQYLNEE